MVLFLCLHISRFLSTFHKIITSSLKLSSIGFHNNTLWFTTYFLCSPFSVSTVGSVLKILRVSSCVLIFFPRSSCISWSWPYYDLKHYLNDEAQICISSSNISCYVWDPFIHLTGYLKRERKCMTSIAYMFESTHQWNHVGLEFPLCKVLNYWYKLFNRRRVFRFSYIFQCQFWQCIFHDIFHFIYAVKFIGKISSYLFNICSVCS